MKLALVYDRVNKIGGAERVLIALSEIWPQAPLYTSVYNQDTARWANNLNVISSFLQKFPFFRNRHEWLAFLTPLAFEQFDFSDYDMVISVTSAEAKYIVTNPKTLHICYCLTSTRYLWSGKNDYENQGLKGKVLGFFSPCLRCQDYIAAQRVDQFIAISKTVSRPSPALKSTRTEKNTPSRSQ